MELVKLDVKPYYERMEAFLETAEEMDKAWKATGHGDKGVEQLLYLAAQALIEYLDQK